MTKTIYVDCPFCSGMMEVDVNTGEVIQKWSSNDRKASTDDKLAAALKKIEDDKKKRGSLFSEVRSELEGNKKKREDSFKKGIEKIKKEGLKDPPPNPFGWD